MISTNEIIEDLKGMSNRYMVCLESYIIPKSVLDMYIDHLENMQANSVLSQEPRVDNCTHVFNAPLGDKPQYCKCMATVRIPSPPKSETDGK